MSAMNNTFLKVHGTWLLALIAAFFIGTRWSKDSSENSSADTPGRSESSSRLYRDGGGSSSNPSNPNSRRNSRSGSSKEEEALIAQIFGGALFSEGGIEVLAKEALTDPNPVKRRLAFSKLLEGMTAENASAIRAQLTELGDKYHHSPREWADFNYAWGAIAGRAAFTDAMTTDTTGSNVKKEALRQDLYRIINGWAANDPKGAIAMLTELPEDLLKQKAFLEEGIVTGLADRNRDEAAEYLSSLAIEGRKDADRLMSIVAVEALRSDGLVGASIWTESLPEGPLKGAAMNTVASRYVRTDPEAAAAWIEKFADRDYAARAVREVGGEWAEKNPMAAVTWLDKLPEGDGQKYGLNSAFDDWEDRDPVAAGNYLLTMSDSPKRDFAIKGFADGYARQDPETAIAWASDISDPTLRNQSLTRAGQSYFRRNPKAAAEWLANSGLPSEVQKAIQSRKRK